MFLILATLFLVSYSKPEKVEEEIEEKREGSLLLTLLYTFLCALSLTVVNLLFRIWTKSVFDFKAAQFAFDGQLIQAFTFIPVFLWYFEGDTNSSSVLLMALSGIFVSIGSTTLGIAVAFGKAGPS